MKDKNKKRTEDKKNSPQSEITMLKSIIEETPGYICRLKKNGELIFANTNFCKYLNSNSENLIGKKIFSLLPEKQKEQIEKIIEKAKKTKKSNFFLEINLSDLKKGKHIKWTLIPVLNKKRNVLEFQLNGCELTKKEISKKTFKEREKFETALLESEQRYKGLVESTSDWIWEIDQNGFYTYSSPKVKDLLGYEPYEIIGLSPLDLMPVEEAERVRNIFKKILKFRKPFSTIENINKCKNGKTIILETSGIPIFNNRGNFIGFRGIDRDITKRLQTEQKLKEINALLSSIFESSPEVIVFALDTKYRYILFNTKHKEVIKTIWGKNIELGVNMLDVIGEHADRYKAKANFDRALGGESFMLVEEYGNEKLSRLIWQDYWSPIYSSNGEIVGLTCFVLNVTERIKSQEALRISEEKYRTIIETTKEWIWEIDLEGRHKYSNPVVKSILGYSSDELIGSDSLQLVHHEDREIIKNILTSCINERKGWRDLVIRWYHKNGKICYLESNSMPIFDSSKNLIGFRGADRNITERKKVETQIERSLRETQLRFEISQALAGLESEDGVLDVLIQHAGLYLQAFVVIFTFERRGSELVAVVQRQNPFESGLNIMASLKEELPSSRYPLLNLLSADQTFISANIRADERISPAGREILEKTGAASFAMFQITAGNEWIGFIMVMSKYIAYFDEEKQSLYKTLAEQGAVALRAARLHKAIKESQQRYQGLVETMSDWIWEVDQNGIYTYISPKIHDLLGYKPEELLRKTPFDLMPPNEAERVKEIFNSLLENRKPMINLENTNRHKDGHLVVFETSGVPFYDAEGQFRGYRGIDRDITNRKQAEAALRESEEQFRGITQNIPGIVYQLSLLENGKIKVNYMSANTMKYTGLDSRDPDIIQHFVARLSEDGRASFLAMRQLTLDSKTPWEWEGKYVMPDGKEKYFRGISQPRMVDNKIIYDGIILDITERMVAEEQAKRMNKELIELNKNKDKFFSILAHDLKSPFQALLGLSEIISDPDEKLSETEMKEYSSRINTLLRNQYELLQNLLNWSRFQLGRIEINISEINLLDSVNSVLKLLAENIKKKNINLLNEVDNKIQLSADPDMLRSILQNFISNAIKFTHKNGTIRLWDTIEGTNAKIYIQDDGVGISKEGLEKILKQNEKYSTVGTEGESGSGLGFLLCKDMITKLEGKLDIESEINKGTVVTFTMPLSR